MYIGEIFLEIILSIKFYLIIRQIRSAPRLSRNGSKHVSGSIAVLITCPTMRLIIKIMKIKMRIMINLRMIKYKDNKK